MIVDTDLQYEECQKLLHAMQSNGFENDPDRIWVRLEPPVIMRLQAVSFAPSEIDTLNQRIEQRVSNLGLDSVHVTSSSYQHRLDELLQSAARDSATAPNRVIKKLKRPYEQRAWLQVTEPSLRRSYHQRMSKLLIRAYTKTGKESSAQRIRDQQEQFEALIEGR